MISARERAYIGFCSGPGATIEEPANWELRPKPWVLARLAGASEPRQIPDRRAERRAEIAAKAERMAAIFDRDAPALAACPDGTLAPIDQLIVLASYQACLIDVVVDELLDARDEIDALQHEVR